MPDFATPPGFKVSEYISAFSYVLTTHSEGDYPFFPFVVLRARDPMTPNLVTEQEIDTYRDEIVKALTAECEAAKQALRKVLPR